MHSTVLPLPGPPTGELRFAVRGGVPRLADISLEQRFLFDLLVRHYRWNAVVGVLEDQRDRVVLDQAVAANIFSSFHLGVYHSGVFI